MIHSSLLLYKIVQQLSRRRLKLEKLRKHINNILQNHVKSTFTSINFQFSNLLVWACHRTMTTWITQDISFCTWIFVYDRGPTDPRNILGVIEEVSEYGYRVGSSVGTLSGYLCRNQIEAVNDASLSISMISSLQISKCKKKYLYVVYKL
jgi:hypothetical protein